MRRHPASVFGWSGAALLASALAAGACATNPVTGASQFTLMSEQQEVQLGAGVDGEVRRATGVYIVVGSR